MTGTPIPPATYTYGMEHEIVPPKPNINPLLPPNWEDVEIDFDEVVYELEGFRIRSRVYIEDDTTLIRTYPNWQLNSQVLEKISPTHQVFTTDEGTELFVNDPVILGVSEAGITDGTAYDYFRVFDKTEFDWLPRNASNLQDYISNKAYPKEPFDEDRPRVKYNIDAVNKLIPDERERITITYSLTTTFSFVTPDVGELTMTDTLIITQDVTQPLENWGAKLKAIISRSAYANGYYHMSLYPVDANSNYNVEGKPRGTTQIEVYDISGNLVRTECYNDKDNKVAEIIEPIYPVTAEGEILIEDGECVGVEITNGGRYYPHNFYVPLKDVVYNTRQAGGVPPLIKAHVRPMFRTDPIVIGDELREGLLLGGEIDRFEVVDPGENLDPDIPPVMDLETYDLSNTLVNYGNQFSYNKLEAMPLINIEERTPND